MIEIWNGQTDLRPLAEAWAEEWQGEYDIEQGMRDLTSISEGEYSGVLVLYELAGRDKVVGAMGIQVMNMFFTKDSYSAVRYWYILPEFRYMAKDFVSFARRWSQNMGCAKMMICDNRLSVSCSSFLKAVGFEEFETVYIGDL